MDASGEGLEYRGSLTFRRSSDGTLTPESIEFPGGRFIAMQGADGSIQMVPNYHIADHLGSVRTIVDGSTGQVIETNDYYAFGGRWDGSGSLIDQSNRYRYNGKEEQTTFGTPYSDYGARQYSSASGRWLTVDPLAEKYYGISPYAFCGNNPVNFVDPDGESWGKAAKVVKKVYKAAKAGNKVSVKGILKSEALDIADNVRTLFDSDASGFEKGIAAFDLATGFGDEAKWLAKTVGVSDAIVDGARVIDGVKFKSFTRGNFRDNLGRLTGGIPDGKQAHHILPYAFEGKFSDIGINIHDPKYGVWLDSKLHNKLSHKYNEAWAKFFEANSTYTKEQVIEYATKLMYEIYGQ